jgi:hypothetical protein
MKLAIDLLLIYLLLKIETVVTVENDPILSLFIKIKFF